MNNSLSKCVNFRTQHVQFTLVSEKDKIDIIPFPLVHLSFYHCCLFSLLISDHFYILWLLCKQQGLKVERKKASSKIWTHVPLPLRVCLMMTQKPSSRQSLYLVIQSHAFYLIFFLHDRNILFTSVVNSFFLIYSVNLTLAVDKIPFDLQEFPIGDFNQSQSQQYF